MGQPTQDPPRPLVPATPAALMAGRIAPAPQPVPAPAPSMMMPPPSRTPSSTGKAPSPLSGSARVATGRTSASPRPQLPTPTSTAPAVGGGTGGSIAAARKVSKVAKLAAAPYPRPSPRLAPNNNQSRSGSPPNGGMSSPATMVPLPPTPQSLPMGAQPYACAGASSAYSTAGLTPPFLPLVSPAMRPAGAIGGGGATPVALTPMPPPMIMAGRAATPMMRPDMTPGMHPGAAATPLMRPDLTPRMQPGATTATEGDATPRGLPPLAPKPTLPALAPLPGPALPSPLSTVGPSTTTVDIASVGGLAPLGLADGLLLREWQATSSGTPTTSSSAPLLPPTTDTGDKRASHKLAEQKRRLDLKCGFDDLRRLVPGLQFTVLKTAHDYILFLRAREQRLRAVVDGVRAAAQAKGVELPPDLDVPGDDLFFAYVKDTLWKSAAAAQAAHAAAAAAAAAEGNAGKRKKGRRKPEDDEDEDDDEEQGDGAGAAEGGAAAGDVDMDSDGE
ncbi:hypothetical protein AMAG_20384 [Allomyces macrogynus ATCC 38327]|uniref:BHLH domain-containing protein n=1 Tax=Allomyces macrogynus (strain ATCC 38327) TaxID=578462 RepID=A0A0L0TAH9_ALLM3|nr:hypothetical protein AMAG_20384 [Allomyces macrogynus ATCC 38327]|eukprot:KNE71539.1 hypothetical protein AMAG_20384 [Allomyces macrogynus ATCC 38327]